VAANRTSFGQPGGNPTNKGGRPRSLLRRISDEHGESVVDLIGIMIQLGRGEVPEGYEQAEIKTSDRIRATEVALDRLIGKPHQSVEIDAEVGMPALHAQVLAALQLSPHERRQRLANQDDGDTVDDAG
jgi:hypothetical protein